MGEVPFAEPGPSGVETAPRTPGPGPGPMHPPPGANGSDEDHRAREGRDGWSLLEKVFGFLTALLTLATAALGLLAASAASERDDVKQEADALATDLDTATGERDDLSDQLEAAEAQIADLEQQLADGTTSTTAPDGTDDPDDTGGQPPASQATVLSDLDAVVDRGWDPTRDLDIDADLFTEGVESSYLGHCGSNGPGVERSVEYSIGRQYERFVATAGVSEESAPNLPVKLEIFGDGRSLWSKDVLVGAPQDVDLDVSGVLRLRIVATKQFEDPGGCQYVYAALGNPSLQP